jgi:gamma-glutamylcyclotransferase (GGCT)/AIG2-like uncharacterized protein YtfP
VAVYCGLGGLGGDIALPSSVVLLGAVALNARARLSPPSPGAGRVAAAPAPSLLFAYGTLMKGEANGAWLAGEPFLGPARTTGAHTLVDLGDYPGLLCEGATSVAGELYLVGEERLRLLDELEEVPTLFRRGEVLLEGGRSAVTYLLAGEARGRVITSGAWRTRSRP